tara:strand:+ start:94 stop:516 length:423 start_codon:yes stop_codon:yes gene_type:complete
MKKQHVKLPEGDQSYLEDLLKKGSLTAKLYKRSTALLELNRGKSLKDVAATLGVSYQSISVLRNRYNSKGLLCLQDEERSGRPIELDGEQRAKITALACSDAPEGYARWSLRLLADKAVELSYCETISYSQVRLILKKTN